jgi:glycosyltransferase involved in cell wall biosynthesis
LAAMEKKTLLVIPHFPLVGDLLIRGEALAQGLAKDFNVYLLSWYYRPLGGNHYLARAAARILGIVTHRRVFAKDRITVIETPFLFVRNPRLRFLSRINTAIVNRILRAYGIDIVLNELAVVDSKTLARPYFIDIVDLPTPWELARWQRQAAGARGVTAITDGLQEELRRYGLEAEIIGNGAEISKFRGASGEAVRRAYNLGGRFVIGYIGNHAQWSGLMFLLDVFKGVKREIPEAVLFIVGPGGEVAKAKAKRDREGISDVIFTGPVDLAVVAQYFRALDLAVLPFELDPHADLSFPIKTIEYGAAEKIVIASPLRVLTSLGLPNVHLVPREVGPWVAAIVKLRNAKWQPEWNREIDGHDWQKVADRLSLYIRARS